VMRVWLLNHCDWLTADDSTLAEAEDIQAIMSSTELRHACAARGLTLKETLSDTGTRVGGDLDISSSSSSSSSSSRMTYPTTTAMTYKDTIEIYHNHDGQAEDKTKEEGENADVDVDVDVDVEDALLAEQLRGWLRMTVERRIPITLVALARSSRRADAVKNTLQSTGDGMSEGITHNNRGEGTL
jgi:hypothetical protein